MFLSTANGQTPLPNQRAAKHATARSSLRASTRAQKSPSLIDGAVSAGAALSGLRASGPRASQTAGHPVNRNSGPQSSSAAGRLPSAVRRPSSGLVRGERRAADVVAFEDALVSFFIDAADILGVPKSVAAIYGICFASPEPLSFSEINERLDISSGSISQGLRVLKEVGALRVVHATTQRTTLNAERSSGKPDESDGSVAEADGAEVKQALTRSRERFEPELELRKLVLHWVEQRLQKQLSSGNAQLTAIIRSIPPSLTKDSEVLETRFDSLKAWHDKAHSLLPLAKTFLKLT